MNINQNEVQSTNPKIMIVDDVIFNVDCLTDMIQLLFNIDQEK